MEMLCLNFDAVRNLHDCDDDLLDLPLTRQALIHNRCENWVDKVSEVSLRMLDVCGITRDVLLLLKEHLQDLQSALHRRSIGKRGLQTKISAHHISKRKLSREIFKCLQALKGMENNSDTSLLSDIDHSLMVIVTVVRELRTGTISIVKSILSFMSISKPKLKKAFVYFKFHERKMSGQCIRKNCMSEHEGVDTALHVLYDLNFCGKSLLVEAQIANKRLEELEVAIGDLEVEFECMFRRLIQTRVSLLNILNN